MTEGEAIALLLTLIAAWVLLAFMAMSRPAMCRYRCRNPRCRWSDEYPANTIKAPDCVRCGWPMTRVLD